MIRIFLRYVVLPFVVLLLLFAGAVWLLAAGVTGERHPRGEIVREAIPPGAVAQRGERLRAAVPDGDTQILFGDLHVHTTYSADAFVFSLPLMQGEGVHPPADACDFARFCAELDFWSINDHAEFLTDWQWAETKEAIRECNAVAGDPANPDLVSFLGWEWTQSAPVGSGDVVNYGHKNVILRDTANDRVPTRPIGSGKGGLFSRVEIPGIALALLRAGMTLGDFPGNLRPYMDFNKYTGDLADTDWCAENTPVRDLPADCFEGAENPELLFAKLEDWGFPAMVIPHGTTWGIHAPPDGHFGQQLGGGMHDASRQRLIEVYSGHGNSERYSNFRHVELAPDGGVACPAPQGEFVPCCWQAGEIIRGRCDDAPAAVCEQRVTAARQAYAEVWPKPTAGKVVPGTVPADWAECGQFAGSFLPALHYRPMMSAQYALAVRPSGADAGDDEAFRFGLIGSSDNHKARPGAGYKEIERKAYGDAYGLRQDWLDRLGPEPEEPTAEPRTAVEVGDGLPMADPGTERNASYYYTAGLVAAHAAGRDRQSIWDAIEQRRVYGTSGPRILLWFDLVNAPTGRQPMGSEVTGLAESPRFAVRALGAFEQLPGCPQHTLDRMPVDRLKSLCRNECYHPSDRRYSIDRIEVVRIRPQVRGDEEIGELIDDPWRVFECHPAEAGCAVTFDDPEWTADREHLYYVRALQEPTLAVNGDPMQCERDAEGRCVRGRVCAAGGTGFDPEDDCLAPVNERAWSSPIWIVP